MSEQTAAIESQTHRERVQEGFKRQEEAVSVVGLVATLQDVGDDDMVSTDH